MNFKPAMRNIPLWSLRQEFQKTLEVIQCEEFELAVSRRQFPISVAVFQWYGGGEDLLSLLVQRSIMGVESYIVGAAWSKICDLGLMTNEINKKVRNPFSIKPKTGTAASYYCDLPSLIHEDLSLNRFDPGFYLKLKAFYKSVRNPLFHGYQFDSSDVEIVRKSFWYVSEIYAWIDQWYPPEREWGTELSLVIGTP